ncbi:MAG: hypothetical protein M3422_11340, partial [Actinomycetota bacterium]|nr:hypothetical protein [Actinomycetota bacterium]
ELGAQAKTGKLRGVRRGDVRPTTPESRAQAVEFRTANGLPVEELPDADALIARLPDREPKRAPEQEDFSQHRVLFDVDTETVETTGEPRDGEDGGEKGRIDSPDPEPPRTSDEDEDFSQQRILFDATAETYRPEGMMPPAFEPSEPETGRSEPSFERRRDTGD